MNKLLLPLLLLAPLAHAQMYKWTDAQGKVHYTQIPPNESQVQKVAPAAPAPAGANGNLQKYASELEKANAKTDKQYAAAAADAARKQSNCSRARAAMLMNDQYEGRTFNSDEKGNRSYWSAEQHAQERARLQDVINGNCNE